MSIFNNDILIQKIQKHFEKIEKYDEEMIRILLKYIEKNNYVQNFCLKPFNDSELKEFKSFVIEDINFKRSFGNAEFIQIYSNDETIAYVPIEQNHLVKKIIKKAIENNDCTENEDNEEYHYEYKIKTKITWLSIGNLGDFDIINNEEDLKLAYFY